MTKKRIGRPRRATQPQTQIVVYLDLLTLEQMDRVADREGVSRSEWIRAAIREKLEREKERRPETLIIPGAHNRD